VCWSVCRATAVSANSIDDSARESTVVTYGPYVMACIYILFEVVVWLKVPEDLRHLLVLNVARAFLATFLFCIYLELMPA